MKRIKYIIGFMLFSGLLAAQTPNSWTQVADFGGVARSGVVAFSIDSFGYLGLGGFPNGIGGSTFPTDFWQYNPYTNLWTQKADFPGHGRGGAVCFVVGSKAYIGLGNGNGLGFYNDIWEYNTSTDTWTQKATFPGSGRISATGFSIGGWGYVGLGYSDTASSPMNDFWQYTPSTDSWTQKNNFLGLPRINASGFSIEGKGYVALGYDQAYPLHGLSLNDLWQYEPSSDSWTQNANYPGNAYGGAFAFTIGKIAYLGTGFDSTYKCYSDFWKYNPQSDTWIEKDSFGGGTRVAAVAFSIGNRGYAGTGETTSVAHGTKDFWMYTPDSLPTGIRSIEESSIRIYPDPVSDRLYITGLPESASLAINDMTGRICSTPSSGHEIDVSALLSGVYLLRIQDSGGFVVKKFVKE